MAKTATHYGECQGCGRVQKLPGGKLSKHGYTVEWGFFNGVCDGANHLPFEQSCDYCRECIESAKRAQEGHRKVAANLRKPLVEPVASRVVVRLGWDRQTHKDITCTLQDARLECKPRVSGSYTFYDIFVTFEREGEVKTINLCDDGQPLRYVHGIKSALEAAQVLNEQQAKVQDQRVDQLESYIKWQQERVDKWAPKPLRPVESADAPQTIKKGEMTLLKSLADGKEYSANDRCRMYLKSMDRSRAEGLIRLGLVDKLGEGSNSYGYFVTIRINDKGMAALQ